MRNVYFISALLLLSFHISNTEVQRDADKKIGQRIGEKYIINESRVIIHGSNESALILTLDIKPALDGTPRTLRDLVLEQLILFDAQKLNLQPSDDDVDRILSQLQKNYNYTKEQLKELIETLGFTFEEAREQLRRKQLIDKVIEYRVRGDRRLSISPSEVEQYWQDYGAKEEATYTLIQGTIKTDKTLEQVKQLIENKQTADIIWGKSFMFKESELAPEKKFLSEKKSGDVVEIEKMSDGFEITKLIAKTDERTMPLVSGDTNEDKKRYFEIEMMLRQQKFKDVLKDYEQSLLTKANIEFKHDSDRLAVIGPD